MLENLKCLEAGEGVSRSGATGDAKNEKKHCRRPTANMMGWRSGAGRI